MVRHRQGKIPRPGKNKRSTHSRSDLLQPETGTEAIDGA